MSKEEIIKKYEPYPNKADVNIIGIMMDEYAKQEAASFIEWVGKNKFRYLKSANHWSNPNDDIIKHEELYVLFKSNQSQNTIA